MLDTLNGFATGRLLGEKWEVVFRKICTSCSVSPDMRIESWFLQELHECIVYRIAVAVTATWIQ